MKRKSRYYSRLLSLNVLIFSSVIFLFGSIIFVAFQRENILEQKNTYEEKLIRLEGQIANKHDDFYKLFLPLEDRRNKTIWNRFLSGDFNLFSYEDNLELNEIFKNICLQDSDVEAIVVSRLRDQQSFIYLRSEDSLSALSHETIFVKNLEKTGSTREMFASRYLKIGSEQSQYEEPVFMITSGPLKNELRQDAVKIGICYSAEALGINSEISDSPEMTFGIATLSGELIYTNNGNYKNRFIAGETLTALKKHESTLMKENQQFLLGSRQNSKRNYLAFYQIPYSFLSSVPFAESFLLIGVVSLSIVLLVVLSVISNYLMKKRMSDVTVGMVEIGKNNLAYRIPIDTSRNDEFTEIAMQFNKMSERLLEQIQTTYLYEIEKKTSEFKALQSVINPHFLYNTLEAIREHLEKNGEEDGAEMIVMLSRLMKYQIRGGNIATIGEELRELKSYINLFTLRYDGEFQYEMAIPDDLLSYKIPKYIFQPILENYFVHGYKAGQKNKFWITGAILENEIRITIRDNGSGMTEVELTQIQKELTRYNQSRLGLSNVHRRLRLAFGEQYGLKITSENNCGTQVTLNFPAVTKIEDMTIGKETLEKNES